MSNHQLMGKIAAIIILVLILFACNQTTTTDNLSVNLSKYPALISLSDINIDGRLLQRIETNNMRIHEGRYRPEFLYTFPSEDYHQTQWPGDMAGRLIISLTQMENVLHRQSPNLTSIIKKLKDHLNEKGYQGKIYDPFINEQQLSGHGWLLSGLVDYYRHTGDGEVKVILENIIKNLVLPTAGEHKNYPIDRDERENSGSFMGTSQKTNGKWILSSDIGCDFIFMDGVINAYILFPSPELKAVVDEMIETFLKVDLVKINAQTHATLTALRGLLTYAEKENKPELIDEVEKRFELYKSEGMTENHENYNWFGRPRWTEPCAVVDSYMVAINLWRMTGKSKYLEDAQLIYYNGMGFEERYSGAYGSSSCSGSSNPYLTLMTNDNHWCCTMRGSDGLAFAAASNYLTKNDTVFIPVFMDNEADLKLESGNLKVKQETDYPFDEKVRLSVIENNLSENCVIAFFIPGWVQNPVVKLNGNKLETKSENQFLFIKTKLRADDILDLSFNMNVVAKQTFNTNSIQGYHKYYYGTLLLGFVQNANSPEEKFLAENAIVRKTGINDFEVENNNLLLTSVNHLMHPAVRKEYNNNEYLIQILFAENSTKN